MKLQTKFKQVFAVAGFAFMALSGGGVLHAATTEQTHYDSATVYDKSGTRVTYAQKLEDGSFQVGVFQNGWYVAAGVEPQFGPNNSGWIQLGDTVLVATLDQATGTTNPTPNWIENAPYGGGALVAYNGACYKARWWTTDTPGSATWVQESDCKVGVGIDNPWSATTSGADEATVVIVQTGSSSNTVTEASKPAAVTENAGATLANPQWNRAGVYLAGSVVQNESQCYKAKWWTLGDTPVPSGELKNQWDSPWSQLTGCPAGTSAAALPANSIDGQTANSAASDPAQVAAAQPTTPQVKTDNAAGDTAAAAAATKVTVSAAIPPMVPKEVVNPSAAVSGAAPTAYSAEGYEFLRMMETADWEWMFPLRSGKFHANGGTRNSAPFANADGSTDTFNLAAFGRAVLQYNAWAVQNGYKQFLNEGTLNQQAQEFLVFWAKSSRETSGSWSGAPTPGFRQKRSLVSPWTFGTVVCTGLKKWVTAPTRIQV